MLGKFRSFQQILFIEQDVERPGMNLLEPAFTAKIKFTFRVIRINIEGNIRMSKSSRNTSSPK